MYVIGIDGGGTKTTGVLVSEKGHVVAEKTVGATNPNSVGMEQAKGELKELLLALKEQNEQAYQQVSSLFAGLSGMEGTNRQEVIKAFLQKVIPNVQVEVDNDAIIALYSGTMGLPGVVQISGTGSITYGVDDNNNRYRVGGWGYLVGDEGSGYAIGKAGVSAVFQAYDGTGTETLLTKLILTHFQIDNPTALIPFIYGEKARETIASLSRHVMAAADEKDKVALHILKEQAELLGHQIATLIKRGNVRMDTSLPIVLTGGVMNRADLLQTGIETQLKKHQINSFHFVLPQIAPVGGAVIAALRVEIGEVNEDFIVNFIKG
ncbi:N-acetylglucosamine kinase [Alkalihalobacillus sp. 1P02AB]|uniref:N-acetylglucosamine kinase n=1 Tax=Alkalihalobacillus sp. 1P02AB TaxID=3132260 RepID=UPI0039A56543